MIRNLLALLTVAAAIGAAVWKARTDGGVAVADQPGWFTIAPPLLAIAVALLFRNVIPALFLGVWLGAWALQGLDAPGAWQGTLDTIQVHGLGALADTDHAAIVLFSLTMGGMVGIVLRNGGMLGVVNLVTGWASTPRKGQVATSVLGLGIFFDDYANSLVVGNTMRPLTDRLRISREKLAYLVDSTAAPVTCIAFVTTWIGTEVSLIQDGLVAVGAGDKAAYTLFLKSIPYSFYPILAILFVLLVAITGRDFGPMLWAERRARKHGQVLRPGARVDETAKKGGLAAKEGVPARAINGILPIVSMVGVVMWGLYTTGVEAIDAAAAESGGTASRTIADIIEKSDSYKALMWGSLVGVLVAGMLTLIQGILSIEETVEAWYDGMKATMLAMVVLVLAWALGAITKDLGAAQYLTTQLGDNLDSALIPICTFGLAAATAFATGTSWGTMGILMPLVFPLAWTALSGEVADPSAHPILLSTVACVLAGAVWGDHCSPISDTTILSSMVSGCDHVDHVRTQLPYALTVGAVAAGLGTYGTAYYDKPWWMGLGAGALALFLLLLILGRQADRELPAS